MNGLAALRHADMQSSACAFISFVYAENMFFANPAWISMTSRTSFADVIAWVASTPCSSDLLKKSMFRLPSSRAMSVDAAVRSLNGFADEVGARKVPAKSATSRSACRGDPSVA